MPFYLLSSRNRDCFLFIVVLASLLFCTSPANAQEENVQKIKPEIQVAEGADISKVERPVLAPPAITTSDLSNSQHVTNEPIKEDLIHSNMKYEILDERVDTLKIIVFIILPACLIILLMLVIYFWVDYTPKDKSKGQFDDLESRIKHLAAKLARIENKVDQAPLPNQQQSGNSKDWNEMIYEMTMLNKRLETVETQYKEIKNVQQVKTTEAVKPAIKTNVSVYKKDENIEQAKTKLVVKPINTIIEIPRNLKERVDNKIEAERDLSAVLIEFIDMFGKSDSELTKYNQYLNSTPETKEEYKIVDESHLVLSNKFQSYITYVDLNNNQQLTKVNALAEKFAISIINPVINAKFDAKLHSAKGEEDREGVSKGRITRVDVLGYQDAQKLIVKAKVLLSRG